MIQSKHVYIKIAGVSCAVPYQTESLDKYNEIFGKDFVDKFKKMTGFYKRHIASSKQTASDLAYDAARNLIVQKRFTYKRCWNAFIYYTNS